MKETCPLTDNKTAVPVGAAVLDFTRRARDLVIFGPVGEAGWVSHTQGTSPAGRLPVNGEIPRLWGTLPTFPELACDIGPVPRLKLASRRNATVL